MTNGPRSVRLRRCVRSGVTAPDYPPKAIWLTDSVEIPALLTRLLSIREARSRSSRTAPRRSLPATIGRCKVMHRLAPLALSLMYVRGQQRCGPHRKALTEIRGLSQGFSDCR